MRRRCLASILLGVLASAGASETLVGSAPGIGDSDTRATPVTGNVRGSMRENAGDAPTAARDAGNRATAAHSEPAAQGPLAPALRRAGNGPRLELHPGDHYFRLDGKPAFLLGRNPAGMSPQEYETHFRRAAGAGERLMRIHFTFFPPGETAGQIDAGILQSWDAILDSAERLELAVMPVLGVWADWNDGSNKETWHTWDKNPFNVARGGPAKHPRALFEHGDCRQLWLKRLDTFVRRWSHRRAIVAWEVFSELDLVTGATEPRAVEFVEQCATVIRTADSWRRPVTASQAGVNEWPALLRSPALDFIEIHPYADHVGGRLDELILSTVRARLKQYGKPVLIGESGLNSGPPRGTLEVAPRAELGIRHAIWSAMVSGAMNGRALWWQDGYDQFEKTELCRHYDNVAASAAAFARGVDFTGFAPVPCLPSKGLKGAMLGNDETLLGWFRDLQCEPPQWPMTPLTGQSVTLETPGDCWQAEYFDPATGRPMGDVRLAARERRIRVVLPEFRGAVAVKLKRVP